MRFDELSADEFMVAVADIAEAVVHIKDSESGKELFSSLMEYRGSLRDVPEKERDSSAIDWLVDKVLSSLPKLCRENGDAVYSILAALDGQTLKQYKEEFTPSKLISDVKAAVRYFSDKPEVVRDFFTA